MQFLMTLAQAQQTPAPEPVSTSEATGHFLVILAVFALGLPFLMHEAVMIYRRRGVGVTIDNAWPAANWQLGSLGPLAMSLLFLLLHLIVSQVVIGFAAAGLDAIVDLKSLSRQQWQVAMVFLNLLGWVAVLLAVFLWVKVVKRVPAGALGFTAPRPWQSVGRAIRYLLAAMPVVFAFGILSHVLYEKITGETPQPHEILKAVQNDPPAWFTAIMFISATFFIPFFEEFFYRGLIQNTLMRLGSPILAILISSLIFAAMHLTNLDGAVSFLPLLALSLALGYGFYKTRSLLACYLMHLIFNGYNLLMTMS